MAKLEKVDRELVKELLELYYIVTHGSMTIKRKSWLSLFKKDPDLDVEGYIEQIQTKVETLINTRCKKKLTLKKGLPYHINGRDVFITDIMENLE